MERDTAHRPRDRTARAGLPEQGGAALDGQGIATDIEGITPGVQGFTADGQEIRSENIGDGSRADFRRRTLESHRSVRGDAGRIDELRCGEPQGDGREPANVHDAINRRRGRGLARDAAGREQAQTDGGQTRADARNDDGQARPQGDSIINNNTTAKDGVIADSPPERFAPPSRFARPAAGRGEGASPSPQRDTSYVARFAEHPAERRGATDGAARRRMSEVRGYEEYRTGGHVLPGD